MFKVGDIVWAKTNRYSVTFYHRPCKVLSDYWDNTIKVQVLDNGSTFVVEKTNLSLYLLVEY